MADRMERRGFEDHNEIEERRRICMNALLNRPWIERDQDPQLYHWTREQYLEIRDWFANYPGYSVIMNRKLIKLEKIPVEALKDLRNPSIMRFLPTDCGTWKINPPEINLF